MTSEENTFVPGPEAEGHQDPHSGYGGDEALDASSSEAGTMTLESQSARKDNWTPWIAGGGVVTFLVAITCCLLVVAAILISRGGGRGSDVAPTLPPLQMPTFTPSAPEPVLPTPTPGDETKPTPTSAAGPQAVVNAPAQAQEGERVTLDGSQSQPGSTAITRYDWDFGDGNTGRGASVGHVYRTPGDYTITLTVTDENGWTDTAPAKITILAEATPEPTSTPEPTTTPIPPPVIDSFGVEPQEIQLGGCVKLTWSASGGAFWVNVLRDDTYIWENAPLSGTLQDCPDKTGEHRYRVVAWNEVDDRVREEQTVTVTE